MLEQGEQCALARAARTPFHRPPLNICKTNMAEKDRGNVGQGACKSASMSRWGVAGQSCSGLRASVGSAALFRDLVLYKGTLLLVG